MEDLRQRLINYINRTHIKQKYIAFEIGCLECVFSRYIHGVRDLYKEHEEALRIYLDRAELH